MRRFSHMNETVAGIKDRSSFMFAGFKHAWAIRQSAETVIKKGKDNEQTTFVCSLSNTDGRRPSLGASSLAPDAFLSDLSSSDCSDGLLRSRASNLIGSRFCESLLSAQQRVTLEAKVLLQVKVMQAVCGICCVSRTALQGGTDITSLILMQTPP